MKKYDLIVAGGGLAGSAAAIAAGREGLSVLLVERAGCLGGAMSNALVYPLVSYFTTMPETGKRKYLSCGLFMEMYERQAILSGKAGGRDWDDGFFSVDDDRFLGNKGVSYGWDFEPEYFKLVLDQMCEEAGVDVLFHSVVCEVNTEDDLIKSVTVALKTGTQKIEADFFIDATGDGDIFAMAGCEYKLGRDSDGFCQPMTTCFRMSGVDVDLFRKERPELQKLYKQERAEGKIKNPRENILAFGGLGEGIVHFNTTRIIKHDPTDAFDLSHAEREARKQIFETVDFLKRNAKSFKNASILSIASDIGIRESRKLVGEHVLTGEDLKNSVDFEDVIALGCYDIDIHNPSGTGTEIYHFKNGEYYKIPYRSLLPKEYNNLLVAGRCLSATHEAQASVRVMPISTCMGEAAGTAIAVAKKTQTNTHTVDIKEVQNLLRKNGAAID